MSNNYPAVGQMFREIREGNVMSADELTTKSEVPVAYIIGLELGWSGVMIDELNRIADEPDFTMAEVEDAVRSVRYSRMPASWRSSFSGV